MRDAFMNYNADAVQVGGGDSDAGGGEGEPSGHHAATTYIRPREWLWTLRNEGPTRPLLPVRESLPANHNIGPRERLRTLRNEGRTRAPAAPCSLPHCP